MPPGTWMTATVCLIADTFGYPSGGGHRWVYLNWALGLRGAGADVLWLEVIAPELDDIQLADCETSLRRDLERHGFGNSLVLYREGSSAALEALERPLDLLLTMSYSAPEPLLGLARRSAMIDIDPGLTQLWIREGYLDVASYDMYFSSGQAARRPGGLPDCGIDWHPTSPCVDVASWPVAHAGPEAPYTTVSHWWTAEEEGYIQLEGEWVENSKRAGFEPFIEVPSLTPRRLELALGGLESDEEASRLRSAGWLVRDARSVTATTEDYASYVRSSRGEFSAAKPSVVRLESGWISDRSLCYLSSGKPCVIQYSGELELPDADHGLLQFRTPHEAAEALARVESDYATHSQAARSLAEERFDATVVAAALLAEALP